MSRADVEGPPAKKRRFFVEEPSLSPVRTQASELHTLAAADRRASNEEQRESSPVAFDLETFGAVVGCSDLTPSQLAHLKTISGNSLERAINIYLDGSWLHDKAEQASHAAQNHILTRDLGSTSKLSLVNRRSPPANTAGAELQGPDVLSHMPEKRYIGAFGVTGWATRSGSGLIRHGEGVRIERQKGQLTTRLGRGGKQTPISRQRNDVVVRFTNSRGEEVGRFENGDASWLSTLLDQRVCALEGSCVYAPDRLRTNDTIYLQIRCFLLKSAFTKSGFLKSADDNRQTGLFEAKETQDERALRLRQVALVRLFEQTNLKPSRSNAANEAHKHEGILKAAEFVDEVGKTTPNKEGNEDGKSESDDGEDGKELEQDQLDSLYKKAQSFDFDTPETQPPDSFVMQLRKYQKQALHWLLSKEQEEVSVHREQSMHPLWEEYAWPISDADGRPVQPVENASNFYINPYSGQLSLDFPVQDQNCLGGILADEMGLGKTIEMLSLIHSHRSQRSNNETQGTKTVNTLPRLSINAKTVEPAPWTTLVVAPMSLLAQWQSEAEKASAAGTLRSMMYYGSEKSTNIQHLCGVSNGNNAPDVIITSYGVILSEYTQIMSSGTNRASSGGLFSVEYFRIILDEAHTIKNRQSKTAKACYELSATHRWVLTGTPIVNRLEDLFSLVHFLRVEPWSNFSFWKTFITVPFESGEFVRALDVVQTVLEPLVLRRTKDMKTPEGIPLVPLPLKTIEIDSIELSRDERDVYDHIFTRAKRTFAANVAAGTVMKSYTTIFAQILRLRQSCCHPILTRNQAIVEEELESVQAADDDAGLADDMDLQKLIERFTNDSEDKDENSFGANVLKQIQSDEDVECPICSEEPMIDRAVTGCWHSACKQCLLDYIEHQRGKGDIPRCFNCREPINSRDLFEIVRHDHEPVENTLFANQPDQATPGASQISLRRIGSQQSAKIDALISHLKRIRQEESTVKSVVFSQFTSFLDLIEPALARDRIPFLRFDGSMAQKQRSAVLAEFSSRKQGTVLLLSLRAGGVGLNLTFAKRVFMMDPWWSFAVEAQAIDRVHRMGQENEVKVVRFIVEGSIEQKMLKIQERKKFIASSLGMMSEEEKKIQRIEDIKELLS